MDEHFTSSAEKFIFAKCAKACVVLIDGRTHHKQLRRLMKPTTTSKPATSSEASHICTHLVVSGRLSRQYAPLAHTSLWKNIVAPSLRRYKKSIYECGVRKQTWLPDMDTGEVL